LVFKQCFIFINQFTEIISINHFLINCSESKQKKTILEWDV
jgi:hypothetical protein